MAEEDVRVYMLALSATKSENFLEKEKISGFRGAMETYEVKRTTNSRFHWVPVEVMIVRLTLCRRWLETRSASPKELCTAFVETNFLSAGK